jgi:hypothetical protein
LLNYCETGCDQIAFRWNVCLLVGRIPLSSTSVMGTRPTGQAL